jgi:diaminopropionate ammonia-lyase
LNVRRVLVKDESTRLGMPSFKILGASWATYRSLCSYLRVDPSAVDGIPDLRNRLAASDPPTLVAATDGNHGHAVARMARILGLDADILLPSDAAPARIDAIRQERASVRVVDGSYDDAVRQSAANASRTHLVISDTAWPGYERVPWWVIEGYATLCHEIDDALHAAGEATPDVVAVQIGVGGLAAAILQHYKRSGAIVVGVEPASADAMLASMEAGHPVSVPGPHKSIMAGLNCGHPSLLAWPIVSSSIDTLIAIEDEPAREAMRLLADAGIVSGESGAAGLAGLLDRHNELFFLNPSATVLVLSTEGATDPGQYETIVGRTADAVRGQPKRLRTQRSDLPHRVEVRRL